MACPEIRTVARFCLPTHAWWSARSVVVVEVNGYKIEPGANLTGGLFGGADLTGANLTGANLKGVYPEGANLSGANLSRADLTEANLRRANLRGANPHLANFYMAYLERADLSGANLSGAYLTGTFNSMGKLVPGLYGANLNRTVADRNTWWPEGFDPVAAGVIFE